MEQEIFKDALKFTLLISLVPTCICMVTGIVVGVLQSATQIQEQSIAYAVKLGAVVLCLILTAPWYSNKFMILFEKALMFGH